MHAKSWVLEKHKTNLSISWVMYTSEQLVKINNLRIHQFENWILKRTVCLRVIAFRICEIKLQYISQFIIINFTAISNLKWSATPLTVRSSSLKLYSTSWYLCQWKILNADQKYLDIRFTISKTNGWM